ncbi:ABC transporter ATP-binding protein [Kocuria dechangensis]|uniref:ABC transporter ATP-binding protein n=1 Tax=Kocuria dechangensis TaxID=1176249 RepID=A0A917LUZ3_9MICC|nr:ABC transporter ATP-binding protein [Kocuria dechangensis]GGG56944.1 ABC transporter ATP-binding protein [Kocuria dechangensis]
MPAQSPTTPSTASSTASASALSIERLVKEFPARRRSRPSPGPGATRADVVHAVNGLSLEARRGEVTALLGPNGAGKTTTLECAQGLQRPTSGTVRLLGQDPWRASPALRARVGVMLQDGGLPQAVRPLELLRHVASLYGSPRNMDELVERLGINGFDRTVVRRLSGGQRQRVALAAALAGRPEVVFLDEPTAGMDPQSRNIVVDLVQQLRREGTSIILTTHLLDDAQRLADQVYIVDHGRVMAQGSVAELVAPGEDAPAVLALTLAPEHLDAGRWPWEAPEFAGIQVARDERTVTLTGPITPPLLEAVTRWFTATGAMPESLSLQPRTLEDVFLDISGREIR